MSSKDDPANKATASLGIRTDTTSAATTDFFAHHERFFETSNVGTNLPDGGRSPRVVQHHKAITGRNRSS
jgi:hypothetical protein